jgi:excisionase family DNA binding protein
MQKFYTPEEVARELRVTRRAVYGWLASGRLPGYRAGSRWRIRPEDVGAFLQRGPEVKGSDMIGAPQEATAERAAQIRAARGSLAHVPLSVDEVIEWKRHEVEREDAHPVELVKLWI